MSNIELIDIVAAGHPNGCLAGSRTPPCRIRACRAADTPRGKVAVAADWDSNPDLTGYLMCATFTPPAADRHRKRRGYYST